MEDKKLAYTKATDGDFYYLAHDTHIGKVLNEQGRWENELLSYLEPLIKTNFTIIDGGANIGTHTIFFAKKVPDGKVMSFELIPDYYDILIKNVNVNNLKNIITYNCGLGSYNYKVDIPKYLSEMYGVDFEGNFGGLSLHTATDNSFNNCEKISVDIISIDNLGVDSLDLLKLDVEGMEEDVLRGAKNTIYKFKPIIVFEAFENTRYSVFSLLSEYGYNIIQPTSNQADYVAFPI